MLRSYSFQVRVDRRNGFGTALNQTGRALAATALSIAMPERASWMA